VAAHEDTNSPQHVHHHHNHDTIDESKKIRSRAVSTKYSNTTMTGTNRCNADEPSLDVVQHTSRVVQKWMMATVSEDRQATTINVNTYFHIVTERNGTFGDVTSTDVTNQLRVLNDLFRPYGFTFTLLGTTRTDNSAWYNGFDDSAMKRTLRVGDASTLNVYFNAARGFFGYATFPWSYASSPTLDGVVVRSGTVPGGDAIPNTEGKTLVHETGHWLGLLHTFQLDAERSLNWYYFLDLFGFRANCFYNNDGISDTPRQSLSTRGCPAGQDTCPWRNGLDPIHNYMDYSDDPCYTEFTNGQVNRMKAMWNEYRSM
jgi:Pregnancy-associated plasma protein-A